MSMIVVFEADKKPGPLNTNVGDKTQFADKETALCAYKTVEDAFLHCPLSHSFAVSPHPHRRFCFAKVKVLASHDASAKTSTLMKACEFQEFLHGKVYEENTIIGEHNLFFLGHFHHGFLHHESQPSVVWSYFLEVGSLAHHSAWFQYGHLSRSSSDGPALIIHSTGPHGTSYQAWAKAGRFHHDDDTKPAIEGSLGKTLVTNGIIRAMKVHPPLSQKPITFTCQQGILRVIPGCLSFLPNSDIDILGSNGIP